jgi:hypothetical protein
MQTRRDVSFSKTRLLKKISNGLPALPSGTAQHIVRTEYVLNCCLRTQMGHCIVLVLSLVS